METHANAAIEGKRLRQVRRRSALTQKQVAQHLDVPRELISMWETGRRVPSPEQVGELASLLRASPDYLRGEEAPARRLGRAVLYDQVPEDEAARQGLAAWLSFLDEWADFLERLGDELSGPGKPPRAIDYGTCITDARRAPTLADEVRDYYGLGRNALPNLWTFLDECGVLTCRLPLGALHTGDHGVAGAFYNHERLGYCIVVNASASPGRQAFAMAHAYAHALYHYVRRGAVCSRACDAATERFANAFAPHFLVPRKKLREMVQSISPGGTLDAYKTLHLASHFRVSYPTLLRRLLSERHITTKEHERMRRYSPQALARRIGLHPWHFSPRSEPLRLSRYPLSVLERTRSALQDGRASVGEMAGLLGVDEEVIQGDLLSDPPEATPAELREYDELPV